MDNFLLTYQKYILVIVPALIGLLWWCANKHFLSIKDFTAYKVKNTEKIEEVEETVGNKLLSLEKKGFDSLSGCKKINDERFKELQVELEKIEKTQSVMTVNQAVTNTKLESIDDTLKAFLNRRRETDTDTRI